MAIGRATLYELIADRQIEVLHIGRSTRIPLDAVRAFVEDQRNRRSPDTVAILPSSDLGSSTQSRQQ
ncbi:MAG TPA: helix-turn-helix domain-containing protein [Acidimicrobiia bacterium]|nr:helix-turn-helix domain-containing protein [Acidimicrobiia bacterium]